MFDNILNVAQSKTTNNFIRTVFVSIYAWNYACVSLKCITKLSSVLSNSMKETETKVSKLAFHLFVSFHS